MTWQKMSEIIHNDYRNQIWFSVKEGSAALEGNQIWLIHPWIFIANEQVIKVSAWKRKPHDIATSTSDVKQNIPWTAHQPPAIIS